jgi:hypothetical protein
MAIQSVEEMLVALERARDVTRGVDVEPVRQQSWTGSEDQRRPQGICLPPTRPPNRTPRYLVPADTPCAVTPLSHLRWRPHRTTKDRGFEKYERYRRERRTYEFRLEGWLMEIEARRVVHREDSYRKAA